MTEYLETLRRSCPDVDDALLREHVNRLDSLYFESFTAQAVCRHLRALSRLSPHRPVEVWVEHQGDERVECTVLGFDYPRLFSFLTGILAGTGFHILSGDVFTYRHRTKAAGGKRSADPHRPSSPAPYPDTEKRRRIIDRFTGFVHTSRPLEQWAEDFRHRVEEVMRLLEQGDEESILRATHQVNEMVVKRLAAQKAEGSRVLYPIDIWIDNQMGPRTRMKVSGQDTFAFLYMLSTTLSLYNLSIESVRIRTPHGRVEDELELTDPHGNKITDPRLLDQIKLSVLLTKQFSHFLEKAPDPYTALCRFRYLVAETVQLPRKKRWVDLLSNPETLKDLARVLGASDFLWEDFLRLQYETLLPMFAAQVKGHRFSTPPEQISPKLQSLLADADTEEERKKRLNAFKDREIFLIDLDHILGGIDFRTLSKRLTCLAELVVRTAARLAYRELTERFGKPRTVGGMEAQYAIFGLGKLGGAALGYASDIELLFVYSDHGETDGSRSIANSEFFERLVKKTVGTIQAKQEGIFHIDLRLRPHGSAGPLACSLENFCRYYGTGGAAHSYERLALVRLRTVGGNPRFGKRVERLRDEMIYVSRNIRLSELQELRHKQLEEKTRGSRLNAKFSPGGLVDLEYAVQLLQVMHGKEILSLRTPRIHEALTVLSEEEILSPEETQRLTEAYDFLRNLINALRMLRGSAKDLFLPDPDSPEFGHLARRMGYEGGQALDPAGRLRIDFETHTAAVRAFVEQRFGRKALPASESGTMADLILSDTLPEERRRRVLAEAGFREPDRAYVNLKHLAGTGSRRDAFARLSILMSEMLSTGPDPDMALNNLERFCRMLASPEYHYNLMLDQPMRLEMLLTLFSRSQFLSDTLIRYPGFLDWLILPEHLHGERDQEVFRRELQTFLENGPTHREWLNELRRFRRREILRIGTRDLYLEIPTPRVTRELSRLAEAVTEVALEAVWNRVAQEDRKPDEVLELQDRLCIFALGKLGGEELNYSSDIDLLAVFDDTPPLPSPRHTVATAKHFLARVVERLRSDLSSHTEHGSAYRVDFRLRPYGTAGELVPPLSALLRYYGKSAALWEIQALLKMRPVAGNRSLGHAFLEQVRPVLLQRRSRREIVDSIESVRSSALKQTAKALCASRDVKVGIGGLRDIEFLVQGLQLIHGPDHPDLLTGNTLQALELLKGKEILPPSVAGRLSEDYIFLRRVEHCLQLLEDQQIHSLPRDPDQLAALSKRMLGSEGTSRSFLARLDACLGRVRKAYRTYLLKD